MDAELTKATHDERKEEFRTIAEHHDEMHNSNHTEKHNICPLKSRRVSRCLHRNIWGYMGGGCDGRRTVRGMIRRCRNFD
jgi:hypothetical protein